MKRIWAAMDARDVEFFGGLLLAGAGGAFLSLRWTLVAIGAALAVHAAIAPRLAGHQGEEG